MSRPRGPRQRRGYAPAAACSLFRAVICDAIRLPYIQHPHAMKSTMIVAAWVPSGSELLVNSTRETGVATGAGGASGGGAVTGISTGMTGATAIGGGTTAAGTRSGGGVYAGMSGVTGSRYGISG